MDGAAPANRKKPRSPIMGTRLLLFTEDIARSTPALCKFSFAIIAKMNQIHFRTFSCCDSANRPFHCL
jgi:hypothetical protein